MQTGLLDYWNVKLKMNAIANYKWEDILQNTNSHVLIDWRGAHYNISFCIYSVSD